LNLWPKPAELSVATGHQREQYALATRGPVGILAGNPGVGKSFVVAQIIRAVISEHGVSQTGIACPTGKAAQRINELLLEHSIHGIEATTMHRMLGVSRNGHDRKGWGFIHNSDNPLLKRFVFLDEQSMTDTDLWASTLAAISPGTHVLCVGDFAQLPPVGHGAPLRDMIAAGLPYGELTEVHRNGGDIVTACRDVKEGRPFRPSPCVNLEAGHNLPHVEAARPTLVLGALANLLRSCPAGIDPVWDVQVLCAINEKSEVSRKLLNAMLQNILNKDGEQVENMRFRMNDKVICGTNQMLPVVACPFCNCGSAESVLWNGKQNECSECGRLWPLKQMPVDFVANGEIGRVSHLEKGLLYVSFDAPARTVRVGPGAIGDFDLGYALSCHKFQGSQAPYVMIVADDSNGAGRVCSWEWWRTGWSRAQRLCFTIGKLSTIHRQCRKSALRDRKTFLVELLKGAA
jgi:exodeoxyribonuclease V alpha subunit